MKIVIFGAGDYGCGYAKYLFRNKKNITILNFCDNNPLLSNKCMLGIPIYLPNEGLKCEFDRVEIAILSEDNRRSVYKQLLDLGVAEHKIVIVNPPPSNGVRLIWCRVSQREEFFKDFADFHLKQNILGNIAECGVYQGDTAKILNEFFGNKKLYLFDTFKGFNEKDIETERKLNNKYFNNSTCNEVGYLSDTTIDLVMSKMMYPENCIIKAGFVPDTFEGVDDTFCLVNLDMDLYAPMLAALRFFYHKMSQGGVILLHDYFFDPGLSGVQKAVDDFEVELGRYLPKMPLGDGYTLVVIKV